MIPAMRTLLTAEKEKGSDHYGNTGRSNKRAWVEMTQTALVKGRVAHLLEDVFYTPEGTPTAASKAAALRELQDQYQKVSHIDDDPRTALYLAALFPSATIYLLDNGLIPGLYPQELLKRFANIQHL
jgi:hypothetical protein